MNKFVVASILAGFSISVHAFDTLPKTAPAPKDNPTTPAKISLGRQLYFDKRLSADDSVSCNTCHLVTSGKAGVDNLPTSKGIRGQLGGRNSPTVLNAAFQSVQFWDGRAKDLEEQAKGPLINPIEMGIKNHKVVVEKIRKIPGYVTAFKEAFPQNPDPITIDTLAQAIAAYERTLLTPDSPVDRYLRGEREALPPLARKGMQTFQTVGCVACHSGVNYSGPALPKGQGFYQKFPTIPGTEFEKKYKLTDDQGRFEVTKKEEDRHRYRVPTLRNVARTAPYFHNGSVATLDEAVRVMGKTQLNKDLSATEVTEIVAFLEGLNGKLPNESEPQPLN